MSSKIEILIETYRAEKAPVEEVGTLYAAIIEGKIDVQVGSKIVTAWASKFSDTSVANVATYRVFGFVGRYRTSIKPWRAYVSSGIYGNGERYTSGYFGRDDRSGRFQKMQGISWEPALYFRLN